MFYPIVIHKDPESTFGVTVPDLPGCFSAGDTLDEALRMSQEAIELHIEGLLEDNDAVPMPHSIDEHQDSKEYQGGSKGRHESITISCKVGVDCVVIAIFDSLQYPTFQRLASAIERAIRKLREAGQP